MLRGGVPHNSVSLRADIAGVRQLARRLLGRLESIRWLWTFICIAVVYLVSLLPLLRANFNYIDDLGRSAQGYDGWDNFSRFLSNFLSHIIHGTDYLTDISPLTQLIAIFLLSVASIILIRSFKDDSEPCIWDIVAVLPLGLNPYFLECLSYKFDAPYMAFSVLAAVFPLMLRNRSRTVYLISVTLCSIAICTTYQASTGIFPMAVLLLAVLDWLRGGEARQSAAFVVLSAVAYLAGILVFRLFIMVPVETYVSSTITDLPGIIENYKSYFGLLVSDSKPGWLAVFCAGIGALVIIVTLFSKRQKVLSAIVVVACIAVMALAMFGLYPFLSAPSFSMRGMYGWGAFVALVLLAGVNIHGLARILPGLLACMLSWSFIGFACTYGNALAVQQEWEDYRRVEVLHDLTELPEFIDSEQRIVEIRGNVGIAPSLIGAVESTGALFRLIPQTFQGWWTWGVYKLGAYYGVPNCQFEQSGEDTDVSECALLHESAYHRIYWGDDRFIVELL